LQRCNAIIFSPFKALIFMIKRLTALFGALFICLAARPQENAQRFNDSSLPRMMTTFDEKGVTLQDLVKQIPQPWIWYLHPRLYLMPLRQPIHLVHPSGQALKEHIESHYPVKVSDLAAKIMIDPRDADSVLVYGFAQDGSGQRLPGVNILVMETGDRSATDSLGTFTLALQGKAHVAFTHAGKEPLKIYVCRDSCFSITLRDKPDFLLEVNVSGSGWRDGIQRILPAQATGKYQHVDSAGFVKQVSVNIIGKLEGLVPSLATTTDPVHGQQPLALRGTGTLYGNRGALVIMDDFLLTGNTDQYCAADIDTVTLLKDAASAAIWGA
jgi:hypothetical protein